jgi:dTDP-4-amino-4,6-dideoxygalactose transaminase
VRWIVRPCVAQLAKIDEITQTRRAVARHYNEQFTGLRGVRTPETDFEGITPFLYYIRVPAEKRDELRAFMKRREIDTGIHWQPGHTFSFFKDAHRGDLSVTERVGREILSLPLHSRMDPGDRDRVVEAVRAFFATVSREACA